MRNDWAIMISSFYQHIAASGRNQNECKAKGDPEFTTSNLLRVYNDPPQGACGKL